MTGRLLCCSDCGHMACNNLIFWIEVVSTSYGVEPRIVRCASCGETSAATSQSQPQRGAGCAAGRAAGRAPVGPRREGRGAVAIQRRASASGWANPRIGGRRLGTLGCLGRSSLLLDFASSATPPRDGERAAQWGPLSVGALVAASSLRSGLWPTHAADGLRSRFGALWLGELLGCLAFLSRGLRLGIGAGGAGWPRVRVAASCRDVVLSCGGGAAASALARFEASRGARMAVRSRGRFL